MNKLAAILLALSVAACARLASADPPARTEAQTYFEAGNQAYEQGQHLLAARAYEEAYRRSPLPEIAFSIAQAYRLAYYSDHDRRWIERAVARYREYLERVPSGRRRAQAVILVAALEETLAGRNQAPEERPAAGSPESSTDTRPSRRLRPNRRSSW